MTPQAGREEIRRRVRALAREVREAERDTLKHGKQIAVAASSGSYSTAMLRKMGHPYARRAPHPPMDPAIINRQAGRFLRAWKTRLGSWNAGVLVSAIYNDSDRAMLLDRGTRRMIQRPIRSFIEQNVARGRLSRLEEAVRRALTG